jgi:ribosome maturation factor RimP
MGLFFFCCGFIQEGCVNYDLKETLIALAEELLREMGLEVIDLDLEVTKTRRVLTFFIDGLESKVTVDQCASVSKMLSWEIEEQDLIPGAYLLQVSSPGLNRRLARPKDFIKQVGKKIKLRTKRVNEDNRKKFTGVLTSADEQQLELETDEGIFCFTYDELAKVNLVYDFEAREDK